MRNVRGNLAFEGLSASLLHPVVFGFKVSSAAHTAEETTMHESKIEGLTVTERIAKTFWAKVNKTGPIPPGMTTPCWRFHGSISSGDGYGDVGVPIVGALLSTGKKKYRSVRAHRLAWFLVKGEWPAEFTETGAPGILLHDCDVRNCVNVVEHIHLGTHAENSADMAERSRAPSGRDHYSKQEPWRVLRGEAIGTAKLTEEQVALIKGEIEIAPKSSVTGKAARGVYTRLAEHFGVTTTQIMYIADEAVWGHVASIVPDQSILPVRIHAVTNSRLTKESALEIRRLSAKGMTGRQLAAKFAVCPSTITNVLSGKHWPDAVETVEWDPTNPLRIDGRSRKGENHPSAKLTDEIVREMRKRLLGGEPKVNLVKEYAAKLSVADKVIYEVLANKTWKHVVPVPAAIDLE